ncbi:hypothetical protein EJ06DRAFT_527550 [Trichodelitschia bisporula]|uniref:Uncharacterized protein n=1 Tax=Trichodelitschia bisporula TaxID=703511 RepID=A0A6G1I6P3_9PEZI|nr:hypothetical protein EJ06DRAFT_527550 [Trichodelitschia bisporula]
MSTRRRGSGSKPRSTPTFSGMLKRRSSKPWAGGLIPSSYVVVDVTVRRSPPAVPPRL